MNIYEFCDMKRRESREKTIANGKGIVADVLRASRAAENKRELEIRVYTLVSAIRASNYIAAKQYKRTKELVGVWAEDMAEAQEMIAYLKNHKAVEFNQVYGNRLSELESDYARYMN